MTSSSPHVPTSVWARRAKLSRASRWQIAHAVLSRRLQPRPSSSAAPPPRLGRRGRVVTHGVAAVVILLVCVVAFLGGRPASQRQPARASMPQAPTSSLTTRSASAGALLASQAAAFLAAYFSWDARDTDTTYAARWQPYVVPEALPSLIPSEPLSTLDSGTDVSAQSPLPPIDAQHLQQQGTQAQIAVVWTIQVVPEGGEGAAWQPRQVQASLSLVQEPAGSWRVRALTWSSQEGRAG